MTNWIQCSYCDNIVMNISKNYIQFSCDSVLAVCKKCRKSKPWKKLNQFEYTDSDLS